MNIGSMDGQPSRSIAVSIVPLPKKRFDISIRMVPVYLSIIIKTALSSDFLLLVVCLLE